MPFWPASMCEFSNAECTTNWLLPIRNCCRRSPKVWPFCVFYVEFLLLNSRIMEICCKQDSYGEFWSDFLTITFASLITTQCYLMYMFLYLCANVWFGALYLVTTILLLLVEFVLINPCARVVKWNNRLLKQNRCFFHFYQLERSSIPVQNLLKVISAIKTVWI